MPKPFLCHTPGFSPQKFYSTLFCHFIPSIGIPSLLICLSHSKFTSSHRPNLSQTCLHLVHHLDLYPTSIRHALPISDTRLSSYTILISQSTIHFTYLSTELHPESPLTSSFRTFPTSHRHLLNLFCIASKSSTFTLVPCQCSTSIHQLANNHCLPSFSSNHICSLIALMDGYL